MIETAEKIDDMVNNIAVANNKVIYVKGYFTPDDGGEGFFIYKSSSTLDVNLGTVFRSAKGEGRWLRQYSGYMNVGFFGVLKGYANPYPGFSNSERIQNMIDYASSYSAAIYLSDNNEEKDVTIFFPNGFYLIDKSLVLKDEVKILGSMSTHLTRNENDVYDYMFVLDEGPVTKLRMENLTINCNRYGEVECGGIYIKAAFPGGNTTIPSGLWDAVFRNILIFGAKKTALYFEGGDGYLEGTEDVDFKRPNQFIILDNVRGQRWSDKYPALKMTGQNANVTFLNCEFRNGDDHVIDGTCIEITSTYTSSNAVSFINSGFGGYSRYGVIIDHATNITFDTCFCEGMDIAFSINNSEEVQVLSTRFANAAGAGSLGPSFSHTNNVGRIIEAESSIVNVYNNYMAVSAGGRYYPDIEKQFFIQGIVTEGQQYSNNVFNVANNAFTQAGLSKTDGIMQVEFMQSNILNIWSKKLVFVNVPSTYQAATNDLHRINSEICAGENIFIRANQGTIKIISKDFITNGNIFLNGRQDVTINNGQGVLLMKIDSNPGSGNSIYQLVSIAD